MAKSGTQSLMTLPGPPPYYFQFTPKAVSGQSQVLRNGGFSQLVTSTDSQDLLLPYHATLNWTDNCMVVNPYTISSARENQDLLTQEMRNIRSRVFELSLDQSWALHFNVNGINERLRVVYLVLSPGVG